MGDGALIFCANELSAKNPIITTLEQSWADAPKVDGIAILVGQSEKGRRFETGRFLYRSLTEGVELQALVEHKAAKWTMVRIALIVCGAGPRTISGDVMAV